MRAWPGQHKGALRLYGHSHGKLPGRRSRPMSPSTLGLSTDPPRSNPGQLAQAEAMITLTQLIYLLTRFPRELRVVVRGDEARADDISPPRLINLDLAVNEEAYYGPHAILDPARRLSSSVASVAMRTDGGNDQARHASRTLA